MHEYASKDLFTEDENREEAFNAASGVLDAKSSSFCVNA